MENLIAAAVEPLREQARREAREWCEKQIARVTKELAEAGNDLNVYAPYPTLNRPCVTVKKMGYEGAKRHYNLVTALTKWREATHRLGTPLLADVNPERCTLYIERQIQATEASFDAYVAKLINKIGPVTYAKLQTSGAQVWGFSLLHVGSVERGDETWKTQQILNVSKLGTLFNQWPTRKVKS